MPISPSQFAAIEDAVNRLAAESILAQVGRDDGLVPAYSLLGNLRELCGAEQALVDAVTTVQTELERMLDAAQPFDASSLGRLRTLVDWFPLAIIALRSGGTPPAVGEKPAKPASVPEPTADEHGAADELLSLNLDENRELLSEFYAETVDHLQQIEAALLALDQEPDNPEALNSIFRSFHTIKGNAGFLGLVPMHTLAHEVESLLDLARNHKLRLNAAIITEILRSRDALQTLTQQVAVALEKGELPSQVVPVRHLIDAVKQLACVAAEPRPAAETVLTLPAVESGLAKAPEPMTVAAVEDADAPAADVPSAVPASIEPAQVVPMPGEAPPSGADKPVNGNGEKKAAVAAVGSKVGASATVRVNTEKLDSLMDVVGELVIVQSQLVESARKDGNANTTLQRNVAQLGRITKELQSTAMSLRMIPIKPTFQKMERLARDLARDFGKKVAFATSGEDTELDRTVVEEIGDPLVHMVRNALDHGLEPAAARLAAGKPETGTLHLKAYHQGSNIVIELQDDGRGMDPDKIYQKAVERGMFPAGTQLSREETLALIFQPGFSTAEKITAVSGRGVGMDVVKRNIEKLRGKIEIVSEIGHGSTFKVKLPLTMAIIDGLVVRVGEDRFILPSTSVQMALRPQREHVSTVHGSGEVLDLRGRFVPIHRLNRRFGIPGEAANPWEGIVVIVENSGKISALLVDEMVSKQEVVIKNLGAFMQNLPGVAGGAILGDGNIALILDPGSLLNAA
jgi:two-component system chemotaxis sensor kinase CheA